MRIKHILAVLLLSTTLFSCDDFLSLRPRTTLSPQVALSDSAGYQALLFSSYRRIHEFGYYGQRMNIAPDVLADNLVIVNRTGRYEQESVNAVGSHVDIWTNRVFKIINDCGEIIKGVDGITASASFKARVKAEALVLRSLVIHDLLRVYSYEPNQIQNGFNKGIVMRLEPLTGPAEPKARSTVQECYTQIKTDLQSAITLLAPLGNVSFPYRINAAAARALLARVLLYEGSYADAATMADAALSSATATLSTAANYATSFNTIPNPESFFEVEVRQTDWSTVDGVNNSMHSLTMDLITGSQFVVGASPDLLNAYENGDVRKTLWVNRGVNRERSSKWSGEKLSQGAYLENISIIRYSEVLLISAEAKARSGNEAGARTALSTLRTNRGLAAVPDATSGQTLIDLILNERRVELVLEGHRFFDLKRLGLPITKPAPTLPVPINDFRVLARIPVIELQYNPALEQNPTY
jgi:hypothetical protein